MNCNMTSYTDSKMPIPRPSPSCFQRGRNIFTRQSDKIKQDKSRSQFKARLREHHQRSLDMTVMGDDLSFLSMSLYAGGAEQRQDALNAVLCSAFALGFPTRQGLV
jgi:hypothetical protein